MIDRGSLRLRLLAGAAVWIVVALVTVGIGLAALFRHQVERQFDNRLDDFLIQLIALTDLGANGQISLKEPLGDPRFHRPYGGLYYQITPDTGRPLRSRSLWDMTIDVPAAPVALGADRRFVLEAGPLGVLTVVERTVRFNRQPDLALHFVVAMDRDEIDDDFARFALLFALGLLALALGLIVAVFFQVRVGLSPLATIQAALGAVRKGTAERLEVAVPTEVRPIVDDLNALLATNAAMVERAETQAGNLAHGLKTPLTILGGEAEAMAERGEVETAASIRAQIGSMRRHIDHHLARSRAASVRHLGIPACAVQPCVASLVKVIGPLTAERHLAIEENVTPGIGFHGARQDLEEMLGNLLENACKWASGRIRVSGQRDGDWLDIAVEDDGPGLSRESRTTALGRGARLDETVPGSGLGLAIVSELADAYGGAVTLDASPLGGLMARLRLPAG